MLKKVLILISICLLLTLGVELYIYFKPPQRKEIAKNKAVSFELNDVNAYLREKGQKEIILQDIKKKNSQELATILSSNRKGIKILDLRDDYEQNFIRFQPSPLIERTRFGDLIDGKYTKYDKKQPIIIVSNTESRAQIAGSFLKEEGFQELYVLSGGVLDWAKQKYPLEKSINFKGVKETLRFFEEIPDGVEVIAFGPYNEKKLTTLIMTTEDINRYISAFNTKSKYLLSCNNTYYCFEAMLFWYKAREKISIMGYSSMK